MDTWTTLTLSHLRICELRREAAHHRLVKAAQSSGQPIRRTEQDLDSRRTGAVTNLSNGSHRRLSTLTKEAS